VDYLAVSNTADVTGGKPIAVFLQSILGVSLINTLVVFYDIHGGKKEVLFIYFVPDTTREIHELLFKKMSDYLCCILQLRRIGNLLTAFRV
jgi:hypothetical protein